MSEFQSAVSAWMLECFGEAISRDRQERGIRFLEEAVELTQTCGITRDQAHALIDYVYGREVGEPEQEVGGVMVTLAALCSAVSVDLKAAGDTELDRIGGLIPDIRAKHGNKPRF